jgi:hypothetical protein
MMAGEPVTVALIPAVAGISAMVQAMTNRMSWGARRCTTQRAKTAYAIRARAIHVRRLN